MVWRATDPMCNESKKICWEVSPYLRGRGVDIGAGDFKVLPHVISVDNMHHQAFGFSVKPDVVAEADKLDMFASASMDFVYSSHTLEHVADMPTTLREWWRLVKPGGYLVMYLPHKDFYPNIGQPGANPDHKRDLLPSDVIAVMPDGWDLLECQERNEDMEYSFLLVFKKIGGKHRQCSWRNPKPDKTALVVRYGAYGDVLQASSVIKGLKEQGFHVTVHAAPPGSDVLLHNPNIDNLILFDKDQVPNGNLVDFWRWQAKKYDKFVNLSESVEGTWLAMPGRRQHSWSPVVRHRYLNTNYLEHQHELADVPHKPQVMFYPTLEEKAWAASTRKRMDCKKVVMWSLSGSSVHKTHSALDSIVAGIMVEYPDTNVVLVGGADCVILEQGWEKEPRVMLTSGKWSIRQTLSFINQCDLIVGPETGVLNAASCMDVHKVAILSHSSKENLTRDWVNTTSVYSHKTSCKQREGDVPACHLMNYGWGVCEKDEDTGTARCMADLHPSVIWDAVASVLSNLGR